MAFKKGDKVVVISGSEEEGFVTSLDEVTSVGSQISLAKNTGKFHNNGKHKTKTDTLIVLALGGLSKSTSSSVFVKAAGSIDKAGLSDSLIKRLILEAK